MRISDWISDVCSSDLRICNGAVDNASGIAVLIEVAKRLGQGARPDRDIYFLATTAEDKGLLGAHYFADHPVVPMSDITVALNVDTNAISPRGQTGAKVVSGQPAVLGRAVWRARMGQNVSF